MSVPAESPQEFSLRHLVAGVRDELGTGDRHLIAKEAMSRIPREDRDSAFMQALTEVARAVVNSGHPQMFPAARAGAGQRNSGRSAKVAGIRRAWPQLRATYACLDENKQLGEYTAADLIFVADHLDRQAAQSAAKASHFRKLSGLMVQHKVSRVRDLPDSVLAAAFLGEAA